MKPSSSKLIPLILMALCGFCLAEEQVPEKTTPEAVAEVEVVQEDAPQPVAKGKTSAAKVSTYFDEIFGSLGQWLAHTFSDDRPIESGNLLSSEVFMGGELAASGARQRFPLGEPFQNGGFVRPEAPPVVVDPSGPRIETKPGEDGNVAGDGVRNDFYQPHSKAEIDRYFSANVLQKQGKPATASSRAEIQRTKRVVTASPAPSVSNTTSASLAIQAVPEPSSALLCGFAAVVLTWRRRRSD